MPCTTTGTTWSLCGHSIYQHTPKCRQPGSHCTKKSTPVPGICPSCTQLEFHQSPVPVPLPNSVRTEDENESGDSEFHVKVGERDKKLGEGVGRGKIEKFGGQGMGRGSSQGRDYFFELHIKQLEQQLDAARIREAEKDVEITNLKAQVELLREKSTEEGYQSEFMRTVVNKIPNRFSREQVYGLCGIGRKESNVGQGWGSEKQVRGKNGVREQNGKQCEVTLNQSGGKGRFAHIAAISFTAPVLAKVNKLRSAIHPSSLEQWFDKQTEYTFECAVEGDFGKMIRGFRDFVDFVGVELKGATKLEGDVSVALKECEGFVQLVMDVEELL